ncbi:membrane protein [Thalassotalea marina]|uniref:Membrane protein n=2 Tax=Thalassotalea marina TaxID=1673741 RepID=A0A919BBH5_9GAMM|nr:membrane protein [Thalassotalea marina]
MLIAACLSSATLAEEFTKQHTMGLQAGGGGVKFKGKDSDGQGVGNSYWYYNYKFLEHFSGEVGLMTATDIDDWECTKINGVFDCRTDESDDFELPYDNFELGALILAVKGEFKITKRNSFYGKIGASFYDYQFDVERKEVIDENGTGLFLEAGWQYRWDNGFGINFGLQKHDMGDLEYDVANLGVNYVF